MNNYQIEGEQRRQQRALRFLLLTQCNKCHYISHSYLLYIFIKSTEACL